MQMVKCIALLFFSNKKQNWNRRSYTSTICKDNYEQQASPVKILLLIHDSLNFSKEKNINTLSNLKQRLILLLHVCIVT